VIRPSRAFGLVCGVKKHEMHASGLLKSRSGDLPEGEVSSKIGGNQKSSIPRGKEEVWKKRGSGGKHDSLHFKAPNKLVRGGRSTFRGQRRARKEKKRGREPSRKKKEALLKLNEGEKLTKKPDFHTGWKVGSGGEKKGGQFREELPWRQLLKKLKSVVRTDGRSRRAREEGMPVIQGEKGARVKRRKEWSYKDGSEKRGKVGKGQKKK